MENEKLLKEIKSFVIETVNEKLEDLDIEDINVSELNCLLEETFEVDYIEVDFLTLTKYSTIHAQVVINNNYYIISELKNIIVIAD